MVNIVVHCRQGLVLCIQSAEPPSTEFGSGALMQQAFGEYRHLHRPDSAGHRGDDLRLRCSIRVEVTAGSVRVWGES